MENNLLKSLKQIPKAPTAISFLILYGIVFILFGGRKADFLKLGNIDSLLPGFYSHISNFSLSYMLYAGIGYFWLMAGVKFKYIAILGIVFLASNLIYEAFINVLNTPDIVDAYYGFAGTGLAFLFLTISWKYGFNPNKEHDSQKK